MRDSLKREGLKWGAKEEKHERDILAGLMFVEQ